MSGDAITHHPYALTGHCGRHAIASRSTVVVCPTICAPQNCQRQSQQ